MDSVGDSGRYTSWVRIDLPIMIERLASSEDGCQDRNISNTNCHIGNMDADLHVGKTITAACQ